jgi:predicted DNA-binding transcriptional regulator AlpA
MAEQPQTAIQAGNILTPKGVATEYQVSERTLANWRALKQGPRFLKLGKRAVRYRREDIEAFIAGDASEGGADMLDGHDGGEVSQ